MCEATEDPPSPFSLAAEADGHLLSGLKQHKRVTSRPCRSGVQEPPLSEGRSRGVRQLALPGKLWGGSASKLVPVVGRTGFLKGVSLRSSSPRECQWGLPRLLEAALWSLPLALASRTQQRPAEAAHAWDFSATASSPPLPVRVLTLLLPFLLIWRTRAEYSGSAVIPGYSPSPKVV